MFKKQPKIYWEKQGFDRLCGQHCLNSLLQGPFFDPSGMADLALDLDRREQAVLGGRPRQSSNVSADGNYSLQVLVECLKAQGLAVDSADSRISRAEDLSKEEGFVCNSHAHWFSLRRVRGVWYNLNSTNRAMPEIITDFYFSAFLASVQAGGYHVFVVRGTFPATDEEMMPALNKNQHWIAESLIRQNYEKRVKDKSYVPNIGAEDEASVQEAIKRSLDHQQREEFDIEDSPKEKPAPAPFAGTGARMQSEKSVTNYTGYIQLNPNQEPEAYFQYKQFLKDKFSGPRKADLDLAFKINEMTLRGRFAATDLVEALYDFVNGSLEEGILTHLEEFVLYLRYPTRELIDVTLKLEQAGLESGQTIFFRKYCR